MIPSTNVFLFGPPGTGKIMIWQCAANFEDWTAFKSDGLLYPVFFNYILECQKMNWVVDRLDSTCTASPPQSSMSSKSINLVLRNYTRSESPLYMVAKLTRIRLLWTRLQRMHLMWKKFESGWVNGGRKSRLHSALERFRHSGHITAARKHDGKGLTASKKWWTTGNSTSY